MPNIYSNRFAKDSDARRPASSDKCFNFWDAGVCPVTMLKPERQWSEFDVDQKTVYDYEY